MRRDRAHSARARWTDLMRTRRRMIQAEHGRRERRRHLRNRRGHRVLRRDDDGRRCEVGVDVRCGRRLRARGRVRRARTTLRVRSNGPRGLRHRRGWWRSRRRRGLARAFAERGMQRIEVDGRRLRHRCRARDRPRIRRRELGRRWRGATALTCACDRRLGVDRDRRRALLRRRRRRRCRHERRRRSAPGNRCDRRDSRSRRDRSHVLRGDLRRTRRGRTVRSARRQRRRFARGLCDPRIRASLNGRGFLILTPFAHPRGKG
jgi:hypothetical protein